MEQWRWMPDDLGSSYLLINIPAFSIDFVRNGASVLNERIIAGKPDKPTPVFSKNMTSVVLRPSWFLPDSIKLEKLMSAKRRGRSLEDEGIVVKKGKKVIDSTDVDWEYADLRQYSIYQPSGDGNALGDVKFLFPNKHSVYLHDTPTKSLFEASERLYSHGCVRLRNPLTLAQRILDADKGAGAFKVSELVRNGPGSNEIFLSKPLPVHIGYFTVWVDSKGEAAFLGDPYGHDERIALALDHKWDEIAKQVEPVFAVSAGRSARRASRDRCRRCRKKAGYCFCKKRQRQRATFSARTEADQVFPAAAGAHSCQRFERRQPRAAQESIQPRARAPVRLCRLPDALGLYSLNVASAARAGPGFRQTLLTTFGLFDAPRSLMSWANSQLTANRANLVRDAGKQRGRDAKTALRSKSRRETGARTAPSSVVAFGDLA